MEDQFGAPQEVGVSSVSDRRVPVARPELEANAAVTAPPAPGRRRWVGLGVLVAALSMIVLDGTIVGVALPTLIDDLKLDLSDAQWVNGIYSVVFAALLLSAGRLGDRFGRRRLLVFGVIVFMLGSLLAALSATAGGLIWARVVQGVGGAFILPSTLSTVNATFRGRDRAAAFGIWGAVISGVAAFGPLLGGWLTTAFSWQWIFIVNLPVGVLILIGTYLTVTESRTSQPARGLDVDGLLLSAVGFGGLVFAIIEGRNLGWWAPKSEFKFFDWVWPTAAPISPVPVAGAIGLVCIALFILWERHRAKVARSAILDLQLFKIPTFDWGNVTALCVAIGEFGLLFVLPLFLVNAMGLSTLGAGLVLAAMGVGAFLSGASARHLSERMGAPNVVLLGLGIEVVGIVLTALFLNADAAPWLLAVVLSVYGLGLGLASAQLTSTILADISPEASGQGSATQSTVRQIGSALGTALIGAVFAAGLASALPARMDTVQGVPQAAAEQLVTATETTAGGTLTQLREQGANRKLGAAGPEAADALAQGMTDASRVALYAAGGFLALGFVSALALRAQSRGRDSEADTDGGDSAS